MTLGVVSLQFILVCRLFGEAWLEVRWVFPANSMNSLFANRFLFLLKKKHLLLLVVCRRTVFPIRGSSLSLSFYNGGNRRLRRAIDGHGRRTRTQKTFAKTAAEREAEFSSSLKTQVFLSIQNLLYLLNDGSKHMFTFFSGCDLRFLYQLWKSLFHIIFRIQAGYV